jgi:type IV pilus assembly protein PilB
MAQRLARRLCNYCKRRTVLTAEALNAAQFDAAFDIEAYEPAGCARCAHTGYKGRVGLYEVMEVTEELRELILVGASALELRRKAVEGGMITLRGSGLRKVKDGVTTMEEVVRETVK